jgi:hypothetical protein
MKTRAAEAHRSLVEKRLWPTVVQCQIRLTSSQAIYGVRRISIASWACRFRGRSKIQRENCSMPVAKPKAHLGLDCPSFTPVWNGDWVQRTDLIVRIVLGFRLATRETVDERFDQLTGAGYRVLQLPFDAFWGARYAIVEDPDGIAIGLMSPIDPTRETPPPKEWTG